MSNLLTVETDGAVRTLTLSRPEKRNALNADLVRALIDALEATADDPEVRVIVLTGAGSVFSAGADLKALQAMREAAPMDNRADSRLLARLFKTIYSHPKPVVAKVNGHAIAGGCGLAAVCDLSVAADEAKLGFTEVRIGFVPAIVMVFVLRKIGEGQARDLMLTGRLIEAPEAAGMGLITESVPAADLDERVASIAETMARETSPTAVDLTKRMLGRVSGMGLEEAVDHAVQMNAFARGTDDCQAGIAAFLNREDPPWKQGHQTN